MTARRKHSISWKSPGYGRERALWWRYGLTLLGYLGLSDKQGGRCGICNDLPTTRKLVVDHDHKTKRVRGLLCNLCNAFLGKVEKDSETQIRLLMWGKFR